jgi:histone deacetylase 1/2
MFRFKSCLIVVHVDDLIVAGQLADREELTRILHEEFEIKISEVMGTEWCRFLGCEWRRTDDGFEARIPPQYFKLIREGLGLEMSRSVATPYGAASGSNETLNEQQHSCYRTAVGRLLWTLPERPDLSFVSKELSRRVAAPIEQDMQALKRVGRYLQGSGDMVLELKRDSTAEPDLTVTTDASWGSLEDRRSTSGVFIEIEGFVLQQFSKTQSTLSQSSGESELVALYQGVSAAVGIQHLIEEIAWESLPQVGLVAQCDSTAAISSCLRLGVGRIKHLELKYLWLQDMIRSRALRISYIASRLNKADLLTKPLPKAEFEKKVALGGLKSAEGHVHMIAMLDMSQSVAPDVEHAAEEESDWTMWVHAVVLAAGCMTVGRWMVQCFRGLRRVVFGEPCFAAGALVYPSQVRQRRREE